MKKLFTSFLVLSLVFSLFGCGERESSPQPNTSADNKTEAITESSTEAATETDTAESATDTDPVESTTERVVLDLEDIAETKENAFTCTYDGVKHDFILSLPDEVENAPLIVMFHGVNILVLPRIRIVLRSAPSGRALASAVSSMVWIM